MNAIQMLVDDHLRVQGLFRRYEAIADRTSRTKKESAKRALLELEIHSKLEEEIFYPAMRQARSGGIQKVINESIRDHDVVDGLVAELHALKFDTLEFHEKFSALISNVERHLREEEHEVLPAAQARLADQLDRLGQQMMERRQQILDEMQRAGRRAEVVLLGGRIAEVLAAGRARAVQAAAAGRPARVVPAGRRVQVGMGVVGADGTAVGQVREVRTNDFLLDRTLAPNVYVPFAAIQGVSGQTVTLSIVAGRIDEMGWEQPRLAA